MELSTIIVNWNTRDLLLQCLASVREHVDTGEVEHEVIVIDNGSEDGSAKAVEENFPEVILIRNHENVGFGRAVNKALDRAKGRFVFLLNSDTRLVDHAPGELIAFLRENPSVGIVGPRLITPEGGPQMTYGDFPSPRMFFSTHFRFVAKVVPSRWVPRIGIKTDETMREPVPVDYVAGAAMMMRRSVLDTIGRFDPGYRLYFEETDLCFRFRRAGLRTYLVPHVAVVHHHGKSLLKREDRDPDEAVLISMESEVRYYAKFYGRFWAALIKLYYMLHNYRHYITRRARGRREKAARSYRFWKHARSLTIPGKPLQDRPVPAITSRPEKGVRDDPC